ncbi:MAG: outer membrane lipoprotein carrier protein LolA [Polyangiaceae bacterium]
MSASDRGSSPPRPTGVARATRTFRIVLATAIAWCATSAVGEERAFAGDPAVDVGETLAAVARARKTQKSLVAKFTQERTIGLLASKVKSTGTFTFVAPDRLRWDLDAPDDASYWVLPEGVSYRTKTSSGTVPKVTAKVGESLDDVRALLGGDLERLRTRYDLTATKDDHGNVTIDARPRVGVAETSKTRALTLTLASDLRTPVRAVVVEGPKDRTDIVFTAVKKDVDVPAEVTRPPKDASRP